MRTKAILSIILSIGKFVAFALAMLSVWYVVAIAIQNIFGYDDYQSTFISLIGVPTIGLIVFALHEMYDSKLDELKREQRRKEREEEEKRKDEENKRCNAEYRKLYDAWDAQFDFCEMLHEKWVKAPSFSCQQHILFVKWNEAEDKKMKMLDELNKFKKNWRA